MMKTIPLIVGQLTTAYVRTVLKASGYDDKDNIGHREIVSARFRELTTDGKEVHTIFFKNSHDGEMDYGQVYIWEDEDDRTLRADF